MIDRNKLIYLCKKHRLQNCLETIYFLSQQDISGPRYTAIYKNICNIVTAVEKRKEYQRQLRLELKILEASKV
jgi:hypothetical protein